mmetsp:Transcript_8384/g.22755  ORF Transcript_8384/g.22755 Transcript_8384/m.22755 type:complete len:357 (+) Transcript_8384:543-1613(+)
MCSASLSRRQCATNSSTSPSRSEPLRFLGGALVPPPSATADSFARMKAASLPEMLCVPAGGLNSAIILLCSSSGKFRSVCRASASTPQCAAKLSVESPEEGCRETTERMKELSLPLMLYVPGGGSKSRVTITWCSGCSCLSMASHCASQPHLSTKAETRSTDRGLMDLPPAAGGPAAQAVTPPAGGKGRPSFSTLPLTKAFSFAFTFWVSGGGLKSASTLKHTSGGSLLSICIAVSSSAQVSANRLTVSSPRGAPPPAGGMAPCLALTKARSLAFTFRVLTSGSKVVITSSTRAGLRLQSICSLPSSRPQWDTNSARPPADGQLCDLVGPLGGKTAAARLDAGAAEPPAGRDPSSG